MPISMQPYPKTTSNLIPHQPAPQFGSRYPFEQYREEYAQEILKGLDQDFGEEVRGLAVMETLQEIFKQSADAQYESEMATYKTQESAHQAKVSANSKRSFFPRLFNKVMLTFSRPAKPDYPDDTKIPMAKIIEKFSDKKKETLEKVFKALVAKEVIEQNEEEITLGLFGKRCFRKLKQALGKNTLGEKPEATPIPGTPPSPDQDSEGPSKDSDLKSLSSSST